jgi:hypothetical protein
VRARPRRMSPYAYDYGAGGAALFDIVNVQNWTRRRISGPFKHARFRTGSGAAILLSIFRAGVARGWSPRRSTSIPSSTAERPADNRKTAVRYRAGEPSTQAGDHYDHHYQTGAARRRTSIADGPERSSLSRLGSGLLIRAPEVQLRPGPPTPVCLHTTSSIGQSAVLLSRRFAVHVRGRVPIALACYASAEASPLSAGRDGLDSRAGRQLQPHHRISSSTGRAGRS